MASSTRTFVVMHATALFFARFCFDCPSLLLQYMHDRSFRDGPACFAISRSPAPKRRRFHFSPKGLDSNPFGVTLCACLIQHTGSPWRTGGGSVGLLCIDWAFLGLCIRLFPLARCFPIVKCFHLLGKGRCVQNATCAASRFPAGWGFCQSRASSPTACP